MQQVKKEGHGCFFYGCIVALVLVVLAVALVAGGGYWAWKQVDKYMDDAPRQIAVEPMPDRAYQDALTKVQSFHQTVENNQPGSLALSAQEINGMIAQHESLKALRGRVHVAIADNTIRANVSMPLAELGFPWKKYFNGSVTVLPNKEPNGALSLRIVEAEVKGDPLPEAVMAELRKVNLAEVKSDDENARKMEEAVKRLESVKVEGDRIVIKTLGAGQ